MYRRGLSSCREPGWNGAVPSKPAVWSQKKARCSPIASYGKGFGSSGNVSLSRCIIGTGITVDHDCHGMMLAASGETPIA